MLSDARLVFGREIQQSFLGEGVGLFGETAAALCLLFQIFQVHHSPTARAFQI